MKCLMSSSFLKRHIQHIIYNNMSVAKCCSLKDTFSTRDAITIIQNFRIYYISLNTKHF